MREAIGGTWLFGIVITFIALFTSFLAYSISYTRAFNMKSEILNIIERDEGFFISNEDVENMSEEELNDENAKTDAKIFNLVKKYGYNYSATENIDCSTVGHPDKVNGIETKQVGGYCVTKFCPLLEKTQNSDGTFTIVSGSESKTYYKVTTFIAVTIPVVNITLKVPITGETRTLFFDSSDPNFCLSKQDAIELEVN